MAMMLAILIACSDRPTVKIHESVSSSATYEIVSAGGDEILVVWLKGNPVGDYYALLERDRPGGVSYATRDCEKAEDPTPAEMRAMEAVGLKEPEVWTKVSCRLRKIESPPRDRVLFFLRDAEY